MTDEDKLVMLKMDLPITTNAYDTRLMQYLRAAEEEIAREGITLSDTVSDNELVIQYAAWKWRNRQTGEAMPRMLRYTLNNRLFSEKMRDADG